MPAVFHNASREPDGAEAVALANATRERQPVTLLWRVQPTRLVLESDGLELVKGDLAPLQDFGVQSTGRIT